MLKLLLWSWWFSSLSNGGRAGRQFLLIFGVSLAGALGYALVGFGLMYPGGPDDFIIPGVLGFSLPSLGDEAAGYGAEYVFWTDLLTQCAFAGLFAAAAFSFLSSSVSRLRAALGALLAAVLLYPIVGSWSWGGGWLDGFGYRDFWGGVLIHGMVGALFLGHRALTKNPPVADSGQERSSLHLAALLLLAEQGLLMLRAGSVLEDSPSLPGINGIAAAMCSGAVAAAIAIVRRRERLRQAVAFGIVAGLVASMPGADQSLPSVALGLGACTGVAVGVWLSREGAISIARTVAVVHFTPAVIGSLAVAIGGGSFGAQAVGILAILAVGTVWGVGLGFSLRPASSSAT